MPGVDNPQAWDRFSYVNNNPLRFIDPTGHYLDDGCEWEGCTIDKVNDDLWEICYPPFFDPHAMDNSILQGSVTVNSPRFSPTESYDRDPLGRVIDVEYWRGRGGSIIAFGDIFGILGDYLSQYAPPDTSTIEGDLYYSLNGEGAITFKGLTVSNNTSDPVIMVRIIFESIVNTPSIMIPKEYTRNIQDNVLPGRTITIDFNDVTIREGYTGSKGIGAVIIYHTGALPVVLDFSHP